MRADRLDVCRLQLQVGQRERRGGVWYGGTTSIERKDTANESGRVGLMPRIQPVQYTERFERVS